MDLIVIVELCLIIKHMKSSGTPTNYNFSKIILKRGKKKNCITQTLSCVEGLTPPRRPFFQ